MYTRGERDNIRLSPNSVNYQSTHLTVSPSFSLRVSSAYSTSFVTNAHKRRQRWRGLRGSYTYIYIGSSNGRAREKTSCILIGEQGVAAERERETEAHAAPKNEKESENPPSLSLSPIAYNYYIYIYTVGRRRRLPPSGATRIEILQERKIDRKRNNSLSTPFQCQSVISSRKTGSCVYR